MKIDELNALLKKEDEMKIKDKDGNYYQIDEMTDLTKIPGAVIIKVSSKELIYNELFGKSKISLKDIENMLETFNNLKHFILDNSSYASKKKIEKLYHSKL